MRARVLLRNVLVTQFINPSRVFFVFVIVYKSFYPHFSIRVRHPQVSGPRFTDTCREYNYSLKNNTV